MQGTECRLELPEIYRWWMRYHPQPDVEAPVDIWNEMWYVIYNQYQRLLLYQYQK